MSAKRYRIGPNTSTARMIDLPASKSISHRICILAGLNRGRTQIRSMLQSQDTAITLTALAAMGMKAEQNDAGLFCSAPIGTVQQEKVFLGNSGSSARFLLPLPAFTDRPVHFYGDERLHQRPFADMFGALSALGIKVEGQDYALPATVFPGSVRGGEIRFRDLPSSQIVTALMMAGLWMEKDLVIRLQENIPSLPYIDMTYHLMRHLNLPVNHLDDCIEVKAQTPDFEWDFMVEKDLSAASYWVVYALINRCRVTLSNLTLPSLQGDEKIFAIAEKTGARVMLFQDRVEIEGWISRGFSVNCKDTPDLVPALAVLGMFTPTAVELHGVENLRFKESDRIAAIQHNIHLLGGRSEYHRDCLKIYPQKRYRGNLLSSFNDHRIAMSFAVAGTRIPEVVIENPDCVGKSYPGFWDDLGLWEDVERGA